MKKRALFFTASIVLILAAMVALTGCPSTTSAAPGTLTVTLSGATADIGSMLLGGVYNIGDDPTDSGTLPIASVQIVILGDTGTGDATSLTGTDALTLDGGSYQFSALIDKDYDQTPDSGEMVLQTTVTIDGNTTLPLLYSGFDAMP